MARRDWLSTAAALSALGLLGCGSSQRPARRYFGSTQVRVVVRTRMSNSFRLIGATLTLDDKKIYERQGELGQPEFVVYDGVIEAGEHDLHVALTFRGDGHGVFSYLKGYRFVAKTKERFEVDGDQLATVSVTAHERGGPTTPLEERPAISVAVEPT